jgi:hypothetical protein
MVSRTRPSSASPFSVGWLLPIAAMMDCRKEVRFVAFSPDRTVTPGSSVSSVLSIPPTFSTTNSAAPL